MQPLEIREKPTAQQAYLAAGERYSMIGHKGRPDFLSLPVMQETLNSDVDHDVVSYDAAGRDQARKNASRFLSPAAGNAHAHGLAQPEGAVLEGHAGSLPGLLHSCQIAAYRAALWRLTRIDQCAGDTLRALAALLL